ncbi:MAG: hypothetical protein A2X56_10720 [Nitrospirae bacterium GWC2_57_13]|nr:MAG: hypothetical protein A2X56_10720 [Nitrospirae bacterium GWC2_57_13]OGW46905.1 MAG: hypothetical protein A2X57_09620 [Nitrospirae bacterium GWD2_57_8]HAR46161.1 hypothetical protein [Nitrospiraceae bacterium]
MKRLLVIFCLSLFCLLGIVAVRYAYVKAKYPVILKNIESRRAELLRSYKQAKSEKEKEKVVDQARGFLNEVLPGKVLPAWYGTPWSFNGNAGHPFEGRVACGSFVENVLRHAGFEIDSRMSEQPSEYIIKNVCEERDIARFSRVSIDAFNREVRKMGEGVYLVGLDSHVGFLYISKGKYRFVHSHGYLVVLSEVPSLSPTLRMSNYRVVGKLFSRNMTERWLLGEKIRLQYNYFAQKR